MAKYTYIIDGYNNGDWNHALIDKEKAKALIAEQNAYIKAKGEVIAIDGYVGLGKRAFGATWLYTAEGANIAGMQQVLSFPRQDVESTETLAADFKPTFTLHYTPDFRPANMPGKQAILVDLKNWTTYVMGPK